MKSTRIFCKFFLFAIVFFVLLSCPEPQIKYIEKEIILTTKLASLTVTVDGTAYNFDEKVSTEYNFNITANVAQNVSVKAAAALPNKVTVSPGGAITALSTQAGLEKGKNTITIAVTLNNGEGQSIYKVTINNYPSSTAATVNLTPATGKLTATWNAVPGASGYWVYYNTSNNIATAKKLSNVITGTTADIEGAQGSTVFVWVQAVAGTGTTRLESPIFSADGNSAKILGSINFLQQLEITSYKLTPSFYNNTENYELFIPDTVSNVVVNFTRGDSVQTVVWKMNNGTNSANVTGTSFIATGINNEGLNTLTITVTPTDLSTAKTYTVLIWRRIMIGKDLNCGIEMKVKAPRVEGVGSEKITLVTVGYGSYKNENYWYENILNSNNEVKLYMPIECIITPLDSTSIDFDTLNEKIELYKSFAEAKLTLSSKDSKKYSQKKITFEPDVENNKAIRIKFEDFWGGTETDKIEAKYLANGGMFWLECEFKIPLLKNGSFVTEDETFHILNYNFPVQDYYYSKGYDTVIVPPIQIFSDQY